MDFAYQIAKSEEKRIMMVQDFNLVADVGGTNTRLALSEGKSLKHETIRRYKNSFTSSFEEIVEQYLSDIPVSQIHSTCIAVAGPVHQGWAELTNIDWKIQNDQLKKLLNTRISFIINDMQAQGYALASLQAKEVQHVYGAKNIDLSKRMLVCGIGTGFNIALVLPTNTRFIVPPSEAGHARLTAGNSIEQKIVDYLINTRGFAEIEEVLSGRGMALINSVLFPKNSRNSEEIIAQATKDPEAKQVIDIFTTIMGSYLGDLTLTTLPEGGIFLIGGVSRAISKFLKEDTFGFGFCDKGRFSDFNKNFGIHLIIDDYAALKGCANYLCHGSGISQDPNVLRQ
ncbi:MAG: glucokinase [Rhodobacteraceae bacterium]|nr:glucokinase [Paracoccaceae bacterium]